MAAASLARKAARRFRSRGSEDWALRAEVVVLGSDVANGTRPRSLDRRASELFARLAERGYRAECKAVALSAARHALERRGPEEAGTWLRKGSVSKRDSLELQLLNHEMRARVAGARRRRGDALSRLRTGLRQMHEWISSYGSLDLQSSLAGPGREMATYGLELAAHSEDPSLLFEWFERARVLVARVAPVNAPSDPEAEALLQALRQSQVTGKPDRELEHEVRQLSWNAPSIGPAAEPVALDRVRSALGADAMVSFIVVGRSIVGLVTTSAGVKRIALGSAAKVLDALPGLTADLDMAAAELPDAIKSTVVSSLSGRLALLDDALLAPLEDELGDRRVVIVAASALAGVPWSLLPRLRGRATVVARSATHWTAEQGERPRRTTCGFVTGPGVRRATDEVRRSAVAWQERAEVAIDADAETVSRLAGSVDVLHIAAHGRHSAENPLFSGVELTKGPWFGYDIERLVTVPDVVLLSACELGRSSVRGAEELVGMTTAWLHAGTRCVIASPSAINDAIAGELLPDVHAGLVEGSAPAEALAAALDRMPSQDRPALACYGVGW
ncbi:MAG: CHAT domain-containing protein [Nocardioides sp.]